MCQFKNQTNFYEEKIKLMDETHTPNSLRYFYLERFEQLQQTNVDNARG